MRSYLTSHLAIAFFSILTALLIMMSAWYINSALDKMETRLVSDIAASRKALGELAVITDRNGADALTETIITDCSRRSEFEDLLNRLGAATPKELLNAQHLFENCGSFYAERKALMVAQLKREYETLDQSLQLLGEIRDLTPEESALTRWQQLIELEETRSNFLSEQTSIQKDIIGLLIQGERQTKISELVKQAQNVSQSLSVTDAQIDELRLTLL